MMEQRNEHKWRLQDGVTPDYRAFHEVYLTKNLKAEIKETLIAFMNEHISEFKGHTEYKPGIPVMLFERRQDAQLFANELIAKLDIQKEHITIKARKFTR
jgi:hypothetical protein